MIWNSPTERCKERFKIDVDVHKYGIEENKHDGWTGEVITIFSRGEIGIYPYVSSDGTIINGGIPQRVNLSAHMDKATKDIARLIVSESFDGLAVIDWEAWRPVYEKL